MGNKIKVEAKNKPELLFYAEEVQIKYWLESLGLQDYNFIDFVERNIMTVNRVEMELDSPQSISLWDYKTNYAVGIECEKSNFFNFFTWRSLCYFFKLFFFIISFSMTIFPTYKS